MKTDTVCLSRDAYDRLKHRESIAKNSERAARENPAMAPPKAYIQYRERAWFNECAAQSLEDWAQGIADALAEDERIIENLRAQLQQNEVPDGQEVQNYELEELRQAYAKAEDRITELLGVRTVLEKRIQELQQELRADKRRLDWAEENRICTLGFVQLPIVCSSTKNVRIAIDELIRMETHGQEVQNPV